jgi:phosphatidylserine/phosphatidylglycerophosphate/cardiolipin synthase-like enzyme
MSLAGKMRLWREPSHLPVIGGNSFGLLAGGPAWYAFVQSGIRRARREVLLQSFIWDDDATGRSFLAEAAKAARRGVRVRIIIDALGSFRLGSAVLRPFIEAGGQVGFFNPFRFTLRMNRLLRRNHRKMAVFDGSTACIGGFGYSDKWVGNPPSGWWDVGARMKGPVVSQFREVFARDWLLCGRTPLPVLAGAFPSRGGHERLRVLLSIFGRHLLFRRLRHAVMSARRRAYICTTYFIPSPFFRFALRRAARRGVDVRLLLPTPSREHLVFRFAGRRHYGSLLAAGVRIYEYQPAFLHAKYALTDQEWALIGSSNLDSLSGRLNMEADLEVLSKGAVKALASRFIRDTRAAREITHTHWSSRPPWTRGLERLFGHFDPWL